jgi:hypothetical protein
MRVHQSYLRGLNHRSLRLSPIDSLNKLSRIGMFLLPRAPASMAKLMLVNWFV